VPEKKHNRLASLPVDKGEMCRVIRGKSGHPRINILLVRGFFFAFSNSSSDPIQDEENI